MLSKAVQWKEKRGIRPGYFPKTMPNALAVLVVQQLKKLDRFNEHRKSTAKKYYAALQRTSFELPTQFEERVKWHLLCRLVPLVENNFNVCELGPKNTGKSHIYKEISPNSILISGGKATVANLVDHLARCTKGLVGLWDVVVFDDLEVISFEA